VGDLFELGKVAAEGFQFRPAFPQDALDEMGNELFLDLHELVQVAERHFRFNHPELGQVPAVLDFQPGKWARSCRLAKAMMLARYTADRIGKIALPSSKYPSRKGWLFFNGGRGQDGRIHIDETMLLEPFTHGRDDRGTDAQDGPLAGHTDP